MFIGISLFGINIPGSTPQPTPTIHQSQLSWFEVMHHPTVNGQKIEARPYLTLPFSKSQSNYDIYQGFIYSSDELKIHGGNPIHGGVDFHLPYGTSVLAPADGYIVASYLSSWVKDEDSEQIRLHQGKPIRYGYGYFVRMYIPETDRYLDIAHLSELSPQVPFVKPEKTKDGWDPVKLVAMKAEDWKDESKVLFVKRGTVIGKVGSSGLGWGTEMEYQDGQEHPTPVDPNIFTSWDKPHIHLEEFSIDQQKRQKKGLRDPYGIYDTADLYPTPNRKVSMGKEPLFLLDNTNLPKYADQ